MSSVPGNEKHHYVEIASMEISDEELKDHQLYSGSSSLLVLLRRHTLALIALFLVVLFTLFMVFSNIGYIGLRSVSNGATSGILGYGSSETTRLTLLGDSLFNKPFWDYDLGGKIREELPNYPLIVFNEGVNGQMIHQILDRLDSALSHRAEAVVLFWDTDCSDVDESVLNATAIASLRQRYQDNLRTVINTTLNSGVEYMAIAGPGLLGEGPVGKPARWKSFDGKKDRTEMLDAYRLMNMKIAAEFDCPYLDVRQALLDSIPFWWIFSELWVTKDGEHLNYRGSMILAKLITDSFRGWLKQNKIAHSN